MTCAAEPVTIGEMSADDLADVTSLCARELVLDRDAAGIPGILMRRLCISLVAVQGCGVVGTCIGSVALNGSDFTSLMREVVMRRGTDQTRAQIMRRYRCAQ
jgi:hypothetical protein